MSDNTPAPAASFLNLSASQWKVIATYVLLGPLGVYYKAIAIKYGLPVPDSDSLGNFLMQAAPWAAGLVWAVYRRVEAKVVAEAARILAAKNAPATASAVAQAAVDIKATGTTSSAVQ